MRTRLFACALVGLVVGCSSILGSFDIKDGPAGTDSGPVDDSGNPLTDSSSDTGEQPPTDAPVDSPPSCQAPMKACGPACVDITKDEKNCGDCGRSCLGGGCMANKCLPGLFSNVQMVVPQTLVATNLELFYATMGNDVMQHPIAPGATPIKLATTPGEVYAIAPIPPVVNFTTQNGAMWELWKATIGSAGSGGMRNNGLGGIPVGLVSVPTANNVFTLNQTNGPEAFQLTTCTTGTPACFTNYPGMRAGPRIVAGNGFVFWTEQFGSVFETADGVGVKNNVSTTEGTAVAAAWDGTHLYWINNNTLKLRSSAYPNPAAMDFKGVPGAANDMVVDNVYLYYSVSAVGGDALYAQPKDASKAAIQLASGSIRHLAQTMDAIYWADAAGIHVVRKP
jgi:hypothetical protein